MATLGGGRSRSRTASEKEAILEDHHLRANEFGVVGALQLNSPHNHMAHSDVAVQRDDIRDNTELGAFLNGPYRDVLTISTGDDAGPFGIWRATSSSSLD